MYFQLRFKIVKFLAKFLEWYGNRNVIKWNGARTRVLTRYDSTPINL